MTLPALPELGTLEDAVLADPDELGDVLQRVLPGRLVEPVELDSAFASSI